MIKEKKTMKFNPAWLNLLWFIPFTILYLSIVWDVPSDALALLNHIGEVGECERLEGLCEEIECKFKLDFNLKYRNTLEQMYERNCK